MDEQKELYSVVIEWDGQKPPTTWYRRMGKLALSRGQRAGRADPASPLASRQAHNKTSKGVLVQEGAFLVESESLANTIAHYALRGVETLDRKTGEPKVLHPKTVLVSRVQVVDPKQISEADILAIERINQTFGRRGKPPPEVDWVVSCTECRVAHAAHAPAVAVCPVCHGTRITVCRGTPERFDLANVAHYTPFQVWLATRFGRTGSYTLPALSGPIVPMPDPRGISPTINAAVAAIAQPRMPLCSPQGDLEDDLALMDAVYIARVRLDSAKRAEARISAIAKYIQYGGDPVKVAAWFGEDRSRADLLDAAATLGVSHVATLLLHQMMPGTP